MTGDDEKFLLESPTENSEPILTCKNIEPYYITGEKYINYSDVRNLLAIAVKDSYFRTKEKLIYHTVSRYLEFAIDTESRLTTCTANFFLVRNVDMSVKCIMAIFNSKIYNRLNKLLFGDKVNRGCNIKKLPIPIIYKEKQLEIERCVDMKDYERIENILKEIFDILKLLLFCYQNGLFCYFDLTKSSKINFFCFFLENNLHMSEICCTFAA